MSRLFPTLTLSALALGLSLGAAQATDPSVSDIVKGLGGDAKPATRSLGAKPQTAVPDSVRQELNATRGLKVKLKEKAAEVIDTYKPPKMDFEIRFAFDSDRILPESIPVLNLIGQALSSQNLASARFLLNGHTDAKGSDSYNLDLSERRALSVRTYLVDRFYIDGERLLAIGFGEERLKDQHDPEGGINRRVEIVNMDG